MTTTLYYKLKHFFSHLLVLLILFSLIAIAAIILIGGLKLLYDCLEAGYIYLTCRLA